MVAAKLKDTIIENFSEAALCRYKEEFEWFENVTQISGVLLAKAETKEARKPLLIEELNKLPTPPANAYIPTNPDVKVHGIIADRASPMQSAAKVLLSCFHTLQRLLWRQFIFNVIWN